MTTDAVWRDFRFYWRIKGGHPHGSGFRTMAEKQHDTEAEALVAALEAAP
jgi:hypothetical protein